MFQPSSYQQAIFDWIVAGRGDAVVNAVAGSGKSTTLIEGARLVRGTGLFCAFNKHIAEHLGARLAGTPMVAKTIHSLGYGCLSRELGRLQVSETKYRTLVAEWVDDHADEWQLTTDDDVPTRAEAISDLARLVNLVRLGLVAVRDTDAVDALIAQHGLDIYAPLRAAVAPVLKRGETLARSRREVDYTDMVWLPNAWNLRPPTFDWVFVDEAQDLSAAQRELVLRCRAPGGRMLFVGDRNQAIQGFAGADAVSYATILAVTQATELPLSICYRCPEAHLELARTIVPQIEARPDAPVGTVQVISESALAGQVREGDLILCRLTAPLISLCIRLIGQRIPARVRGRDIGRQLADMVRKVALLRDFTFAEFTTFLNAYAAKQTKVLEQRQDNEAQIAALNDRVAGVLACYESYHSASVEALCQDIEALFADDRASVWLSTIHRAKGLEAARVAILQPDKLPLRWKKQQPWQLEQEHNLLYVALTRASETLCFVGEAPKAMLTPSIPAEPPAALVLKLPEPTAVILAEAA